MDPLTFELDAAPVPACGITRLHLRRLHAGEFADDKRKDLLAHTESCLDCQTVLAELRSDEAAFRTHIPWDKFVLAHEKKAAAAGVSSKAGARLWTWLTGGGIALGLAAVAATLLLAPKTIITQDTRIKGDAVDLAYLLKTPEGLRPGRSGETLHEGDQIQLLVKGPADGMGVVIVEIDGKGQVNVLHFGAAPANGVQAAAPLPDSMVLDDAVGPERFFAIYAPMAELEKVRTAAVDAARKMAEQKVDLNAVERLPLDGVLQDSVLIVKVRR